MARLSGLILVALLVGGCGPSAEEQAAAEEAVRQQALADTMRLAEAAYDAAAFDTVSWESDAAALERGEVVFSFSCAKCHGDAGDGTGGFVTRGDTLRPPSFLAQDWRFSDDHVGLRRQISVGTTGGMPHWDLEGLKPRDIDAVATYIRSGLRSQ